MKTLIIFVIIVISIALMGCADGYFEEPVSNEECLDNYFVIDTFNRAHITFYATETASFWLCTNQWHHDTVLTVGRHHFFAEWTRFVHVTGKFDSLTIKSIYREK